MEAETLVQDSQTEGSNVSRSDVAEWTDHFDLYVFYQQPDAVASF